MANDEGIADSKRLDRLPFVIPWLFVIFAHPRQGRATCRLSAGVARRTIERLLFTGELFAMEPWVWSIILFLLALAIIALELFIPSGGVLGVLATLAIIGSLVMAFLSGWGAGATMTVVVIVVVPLVLASALKWWPHTPIGRRILNPPPENADDVLPENDLRYELRELIGTLAMAKTKMLPSGIVMIGKRSYDAVGDGPAIEPGQVVRVIGVDMNRLEVRLVTRDSALADPKSTTDSSTDRATGDDILQRPLEAFGLEPLDDSKRT